MTFRSLQPHRPDPESTSGGSATERGRRRAPIALLAAVVLAACSGSDGSTSPSSTDVAPTSTIDELVGERSSAFEELSTPPTSADGEASDAADEPASEGRMGVLVHAKSEFDQWSETLDPDAWREMRSLYDSMVVYSPYFDERLPLFDETFAYRDLYGLRVDSERDRRAYENPEWVLRTADDEPVYIPFACDDADGCSQFAADIGDPDYREAFIANVHELVERGHEGLLIDDVNMVWRLSDRFGEPTTPIDPRTGRDLTLEDWNLYVVEFVEAVRAEFPELAIMHNSLWFADSPSLDDPLVERQIAAADVIMIERGATDPGLTAGDGQYGFESLLDYVDRVHRLGGNVLLLDETATTQREQVLNLAAGLLGNDGDDLTSTEDYELVAPETFWDGFEIDLGAANGPRQRFGEVEGVWRRDFELGIVVLNEPGREATELDLGGLFVDSTGTVIDRIELEPGEAALLARTS